MITPVTFIGKSPPGITQGLSDKVQARSIQRRPRAIFSHYGPELVRVNKKFIIMSDLQDCRLSNFAMLLPTLDINIAHKPVPTRAAYKVYMA